MRQSDPVFQKLLSEVRLGIVTQETQDILKKQVGKVIEGEIRPTKLYSHRTSVEDLNNSSLRSLIKDDNRLVSFASNDEVKTKQMLNSDIELQFLGRLDKACQGLKQLDLCVGAQVMLIQNLDLQAGLCNGSRGVVKAFKDQRPIVKFRNGIEVIIQPFMWELRIDEEVSVFRTQLPLILAWAPPYTKLKVPL